MWTIDEFGNATNGTDKAIVIEAELSTRFDVTLLEKRDGKVVTTPLKLYLPEQTAKEYVRKLVDFINEYGEDSFVELTNINAEATT